MILAVDRESGAPNGLCLSGERPSRAERLPVASCTLQGGSAAGPTNGRSTAPGRSYAARATWTVAPARLWCVTHPRAAIPPHRASCGELAAVDDAATAGELRIGC